MEIGKKVWVFSDGDLPPQGDEEPLGHEALMVTNYNDVPANIRLELLFEDKDPETDIDLKVDPKRVRCFRMDFPVGERQYTVKPGQYSLVLFSDVPVVCLYGRLDRRKDMAYYPIAGFSV